MNTRQKFVSVLLLVCVMLSACARATTPMSGNASVNEAPFTGIYEYLAFSKYYQLVFLPGHRYLGYFDSGTFSVDDQQVTFTSDQSICRAVAGTYTWSVDGTALHFVAVSDDCKNRKIVLEKQLFEHVLEANTDITFDWAIMPPPYNFVSMDTDGNVYMTGEGPSFFKYDANGAPVKTWADNALTFPTGIAVDQADNMYVANFDNATVHKYDPDGKPLMQWSVAGGEIGPVGLAVDSDGNVYVALHRLHDHYIEKYDPQGNLLDTWAPSGTGEGQIMSGSRSGPSEIALDPMGNTFISDDRGITNKYGPDGEYIYSVDFNVGAVDSQGYLYVLDQAERLETSNTLLRFDAAGKPAGQWVLPFHGIFIAAGGGDGSLLIMVEGGMLIKIKLPAS